MSISDDSKRWWLKWLKFRCLKKSSDEYKDLLVSNNRELNDVDEYELLDFPNECIHEIFDRLDILGLCRMADVSKRFRAIAEKTFRKRYNELDYKDVGYKRSLLRRVLCKFGHLITSIDDGYCILRVKEQIDTYAISVYCTKLEDLTLRGMIIDCDEMKRLFSRLKSLKLVWCEFLGYKYDLFKNCRKLQVLYFYHAKYSGFIGKKYPKLVDLQFDTACRDNKTIVKLISRNPQLHRLLIPVEMNDFFISTVVQHASNLECLRFSPGIMPTVKIPTYTEQGLMQLSRLKKLKTLHLNTKNETYTKSIAALMNALAEEKVALEVAYLRNFSIYPEDVRSFNNLKTITAIVWHEIAACSDDDLISIVRGLPSLNTLMLHFSCNNRNHFTVYGLISVVKAGKELRYVHLNGVQNFRIDQIVNDKLAEAVKSQWMFRDMKKLFIQICACKCTSSLDIPIGIRREYAKLFWYTIDFTEPRLKCINCAE